MTRAIALLAALSLAGAGCGAPRVGDPEPAPAGGSGPAPTYAAMSALFAASCATSGCHTGDPPRSAPDAFDPDVAYALVGKPSLQVPGMAVVEPGDPEASYLVAKLAGTAGAVGGVATRMPLGRPPLSEADLAAVEAWIRAGAHQ